jgi:hypothetical protein
MTEGNLHDWRGPHVIRRVAALLLAMLLAGADSAGLKEMTAATVTGTCTAL